MAVIAFFQALLIVVVVIILKDYFDIDTPTFSQLGNKNHIGCIINRIQ